MLGRTLIMDEPQNIHINLGKGFEFSIAQNVGAGSENGVVEIALIDDRNDVWKFVPMAQWLYEPDPAWRKGYETVDVEGWLNAEDLSRALRHAVDYVRDI